MKTKTKTKAKKGVENKLVIRLVKLMAKKDLNQSQVARMIPICDATVNRYLQGHREPVGLYAVALENFLNKQGG